MDNATHPTHFACVVGCILACDIVCIYIHMVGFKGKGFSSVYLVIYSRTQKVYYIAMHKTVVRIKDVNCQFSSHHFMYKLLV